MLPSSPSAADSEEMNARRGVASGRSLRTRNVGCRTWLTPARVPTTEMAGDRRGAYRENEESLVDRLKIHEGREGG